MKKSDGITPLLYSMKLGQTHRDITILIVGALSRWVNRLTDAEVTEKKNRSLLKALRMNLRLAIDYGLRMDQSDLIASLMQTLIMSEGDRWIQLQSQLVGIALRNGPPGQPVETAESAIRNFATRELGKAELIASLEE